MTIAPKSKVGRYEIISVLGKGGMGEVYLARDTELGRKVAIKILADDLSSDREQLERFIQEAKATSALNHPNIITVFEILEHEGRRFIVSEYVAGEMLSRRLRRKRCSIMTALDIAIQITSALAAAHETGIIHRDIKPDNVMVRTDGIVKVLDFGLAKLTVRNPSAGVDPQAATLAKVMTIPGMILGTAQYMSPEQARGKNVDARTDVFSLGVLLYEMITGHLPFEGEDQMDIIGSILKDEPPPLARHVEEVPAELEHIVNKALRKKPDQRYQNIRDLLIDLEDLRDELKFEAKLVHTTDSAKTRLTVRDTRSMATARRFSFVHIVLFLAAAALVSVLGWWFVGGTEGLPETSAAYRPGSFRTVELTSWNNIPGELDTHGSFSPDARMIAFSSTRAGDKSVWVKQTASGEPVQVTRDEFDNTFPVWSPDGTELAFFSTRGNRAAPGGNVTGIWRIPALGGTPRSVIPVDDGSAQIRKWGASGRIYYESDRNLYALDPATGRSARLTSFDEKKSPVEWINISADEKKIVYLTGDQNAWKIHTRQLDSDASDELLELETETDNLIWHPDGRRIFYNTLVNGTFQIFIFDVSEKDPKQITFSERDSFLRDVSADGKKVLYASAKEESDIWVVDAEKAEETAFITEINSDLWADVAPDGRTVVFQSIKNLSQGDKLFRGGIKTRSLGESSGETPLAEEGFLPAWSPDGETIAFLRRIDEKPQLMIIKRTGGEARALTRDGIVMSGFTLTPYNRTQTREFDWAPDGRRLAYVSAENGNPEIRAVPITGAASEKISRVGARNLYLYCPTWSPDGTRLAFSAKSRQRNAGGKTVYSLWLTETASGETVRLLERNENIRLLGFSADGANLIYAVTSGSDFIDPEVGIYSLSTATGSETLLRELRNVYFNNIHLSPDAGTIAFVGHEDEKDDLWIVPAGGGGPRKLTGNNDPRLYFSSIAWSPDGKRLFFGKQSRFSLLSMIADFE